MFSNLKTQQQLSKKDFKSLLPELRAKLLELQRTLKESKTPVIVLFAGVDGAGKHEMINSLNEWMNPGWIVTRAYGQPSDEESQRPEWWRYWRDLPPKGQIALFQSAWYSKPLLDYVGRRSDENEFYQALEHIETNERMLTDGGALVIKFWLHLSKDDQLERFQKLESDPKTAWQVIEKDWANWARYDRFMDAANLLISATNKPDSKWHIIDGFDENWRSVEVANVLSEAITEHLESPSTASEPLARRHAGTRFADADMSITIEKKQYKKELKRLQAKLARLHRKANQSGISTVCVFEGWDAAGKGGAIRRLIHPMEARHYRVIPIAAPTDEENAQHYLWRFWRHLPRDGKVTIFDRSWYGRGLVERIEGFCSEEDWQRSFNEINEFEASLTDHGTVVCKFWLHITPEEQLKRFDDRALIPYKAWKLTDEDWRNREKWDDYALAAEDIFANTSVESAPWTIVPANDKRLARLNVLETVCTRLEKALK
jgi:polyphosphate:AMP phosphotransferase